MEAFDDTDTSQFNWNPTPDDSDVIQYHLTNFKLTRPDGEMNSPLVESKSTDEQFFHLQGDLISVTNPAHQKRIEVVVKQYFIDLGVSPNSGETDSTQGFWMTGKDPDSHFKLVLPSDPGFRDLATVVELAHNPKMLGHYSFPFDSVHCLHMSKFSLTDRDIEAHQTLILPSANKNLLALRGVISANEAVESLPSPGTGNNYGALRIQTYIQNKYVIDLGNDKFALHPEFCVQDCHGTWIILREPPHVAYRSDFEMSLKRTVGHIDAYNWPAERGETWRHITNYRLTDKTGALHSLEIGDLGELGELAEYTLWGELLPPPRAACPPVKIMLCVNSYSLDTGRSLYDPEKGVWMQDVRGDWYKLCEPAPDYQHIAAPLLEKAAQYIRFHDALLFQDKSASLSMYLNSNGKYLCNCRLDAAQRFANPKFDMYFIQEHKLFVLQHLEADYDFASSCLLIATINELSGVKPPPVVRAETPAPAQARNGNRISPKDNTRTASEGSDSDFETPQQRRGKLQRSRDGDSGSQESKRRRSDSVTTTSTSSTAAAGGPRRITKKTIAVEADEDSSASEGRGNGRQDTSAKPGTVAAAQQSSQAPNRLQESQQVPSRLGMMALAEISSVGRPTPAVNGTAPSAAPAKPKRSRFADADDEVPPARANQQSSLIATSQAAQPPGVTPQPPRFVQHPAFVSPPLPPQAQSSSQPVSKGNFQDSIKAYLASANKPQDTVQQQPPVRSAQPVNKADFVNFAQTFVASSNNLPEAPQPRRAMPPPPFAPRPSAAPLAPAAPPAPPLPPVPAPAPTPMHDEWAERREDRAQSSGAGQGMARWEAYESLRSENSEASAFARMQPVRDRQAQQQPAGPPPAALAPSLANNRDPRNNRTVDPRIRPPLPEERVPVRELPPPPPAPPITSGVASAGTGRGRGATLPAWMTAQNKPSDTIQPPAVEPSGGRGRGATLPAWMTAPPNKASETRQPPVHSSSVDLPVRDHAPFQDSTGRSGNRDRGSSNSRDREGARNTAGVQDDAWRGRAAGERVEQQAPTWLGQSQLSQHAFQQHAPYARASDVMSISSTEAPGNRPPKGILKSSSQFPDRPFEPPSRTWSATGSDRGDSRDSRYSGLEHHDSDRSRSRERTEPNSSRGQPWEDRRTEFPSRYPRDLDDRRGEYRAEAGGDSGGFDRRGHPSADSYRRDGFDDANRSVSGSAGPRGQRTFNNGHQDTAPQRFDDALRPMRDRASTEDFDVGDFRRGRPPRPAQVERAVTAPTPVPQFMPMSMPMQSAARNQGTDKFDRASERPTQSAVKYDRFGEPIVSAPQQSNAPSSSNSSKDGGGCSAGGGAGGSGSSKPTKVNCAQCRGILKKESCTNAAHKHGYQVRVSDPPTPNLPPPPSCAGSTGQSMSSSVQASSQHSYPYPGPCYHQQQTQLHSLDTEVGINTLAANDEAAFALLTMVASDPHDAAMELDTSCDEATSREIVSNALVELHSSPVPSPLSSPRAGNGGNGGGRVAPLLRPDSEDEVSELRAAAEKAQQRRAHAQAGDTLLEVQSAPPAVASKPKDELSAERARYLRHKQQNSAESASEDGSKPSTTTTAAVIRSPRHGVWGKGIAPVSKSASDTIPAPAANMPAVFKLGERTNDPKKRMEQMSRNSLGVYAVAAAEKAAAERHVPPSASARPAKSALRNSSFTRPGGSSTGGNGGNGNSTSSEDCRSATSERSAGTAGTSCSKPVKWKDVEGSALYTRHTYENEYDLSLEGFS